MNNKAYFFCDINDFDSLVMKTREALSKKYVCQKYRVIDTINLADKEFMIFKNSICKPQLFLGKITSQLTFSKDGEYLCLAVTNEHSDAIILVCSFQYPYPKFVAVVRRDGYGEKIY